MKQYELVAAMVLRVGQDNLRAFTWSELGGVFSVSKDKMRHQLNRFKEKYNIIDSEVVLGWNRTFLDENTPEDEKDELADLIQVPGDVLVVDGTTHVVVDTNEKVWFLLDDNIDWARCLDVDYLVLPKSKKSVKKLKASKVAKPVNDIKEPLKFLSTPVCLVVIRDGQPLTIDKTHKNFTKIEVALKAGDWQAALDFIDQKAALTRYSNGRVVIEGGGVNFDGKPVNSKLTKRLLACLTEENVEALDALSAFMVKCDENPDFQVVTRIYDFLAHNDLRLDKEGYILAYKIVRNNYLDKHSGTMDNSPGKVVQMKRNLVNSKDSQTCSTGLHVAAKGYLASFGSVAGGDKVLLCRVNPRDFVSIPTDYNDQKARCCEYLVLKDITENFKLEDTGIEA